MGKILVPYPIESALSGVKKVLKPENLLWYKRSFNKPAIKAGQRLLLHFGAVDFEATIFLNGKELGSHRGGYQRFTLDATDAVRGERNELIVKVWDPTDAGPNPHGKQVLSPQGIMYTPSSGIWQTVWMEVVPDSYIESLKITTDIDKQQVSLDANINHADRSATPLRAQVKAGSKVINSTGAPAGSAHHHPGESSTLMEPG